VHPVLPAPHDLDASFVEAYEALRTALALNSALCALKLPKPDTALALSSCSGVIARVQKQTDTDWEKEAGEQKKKDLAKAYYRRALAQ
jgi:uncharacterized protein YijF (DUF1287 family)